jgi:tRNA A37 methylthiotransferase MiaB
LKPVLNRARKPGPRDGDGLDEKAATPMTTASTTAPAIGAIATETPLPRGIDRLTLLLIKPSKYDDDGYVMRFVRGVLPSNTLATLAGLTDEVAARGDLGVPVRSILLDETVQRIDPARLARRHCRPGARVVVALCGVQTNQFPRAADLALQFKAAGIPVMMGGFHVSGAIAMSETGIPAECRAMIDAGITLVRGEVEEVWEDLLRDALHGALKPYYEILTPPDLSRANLPRTEPKLMKRFAYPYMGTIDAGRGCPFKCTFCTIINVQGRTMRCRDARAIKETIRDNYARKVDYYFFTDDNFSRNPQWEAIFDALIELRRDEGIDIAFMMQIDTQAWRIKGFQTKAAEAGCRQVFIGMESINPANLKAAGKRQNNVAEFPAMIEAWHDHGIACHVGYIIGFPYDTPSRCARTCGGCATKSVSIRPAFSCSPPCPAPRITAA